MTALGTQTQEDLVFELRARYGLRTSQKRISSWLGGHNDPDYEAAITLLDAAGLLNAESNSSDIAGDVATELVRRLDAGEKFPAARLLEVAEALTEAAQQALRLAARLQRAARTAKPNG